MFHVKIDTFHANKKQKNIRMLACNYRMLQVDIVFMTYVTNIRLRVIRAIRVTK